MVLRSVSISFFVLASSLAATGQTWTCKAKPSRSEKYLTSSTRYTTTEAGFDLTPSPTVQHNVCTANLPFYFSAALAEGNYEVAVVLGGGDQPSTTTVKAEGRRLMLLNIATAAHKTITEQFTVNIRTTSLPDGKSVKIKPREVGSPRWDEKLTLEFNGTNPSVQSITIKPAPNVPTIYLAGDSTVVDQDKEPWAAWGQVLPLFFGPEITVANHAESGETIASSTSELRFQKIFTTLHKGDYLFLQFGHNDQKPGPGNVPAETTYTELNTRYINMARERGATPVLVTSMNRRTYNEAGNITDTLAPYPQTIRKIAAEQHVALVDLNACSKQLYEAIGEPHSRELFVYAPANTYPGQTEVLHDDTHFNSFGAYELARCVVRDLRAANLPLTHMLRKNVKSFDPMHPDTPESAHIPTSPTVDTTTPYGR